MKALEIRPRVQECLDEFIQEQRPLLNKVSPSLDPLADFAHEFLSGGKRLRAAFVTGDTSVLVEKIPKN